MSAAMPRTRGVVFIHSTPAALSPHIQWALEAALGGRVQVEWQRQPAASGQQRMEYSWVGAPGTGARLASALRDFGWTNKQIARELDVHPTTVGRWLTTDELPPTGSEVHLLANTESLEESS